MTRSTRPSTASSRATSTVLTPAAADALLRYPWPGNVRELRNALERAVVVCDGDLIGVGHLPRELAPRAPTAAVRAQEAPVGTSLDEMERDLILRTLEAAGGNKTRTAEILGISVRTLHNKLQRYRT